MLGSLAGVVSAVLVVGVGMVLAVVLLALLITPYSHLLLCIY